MFELGSQAIILIQEDRERIVIREISPYVEMKFEEF